ncbi:unnamed protein product [Phaeothamnion confervicola]
MEAGLTVLLAGEEDLAETGGRLWYDAEARQLALAAAAAAEAAAAEAAAAHAAAEAAAIAAGCRPAFPSGGSGGDDDNADSAGTANDQEEDDAYDVDGVGGPSSAEALERCFRGRYGLPGPPTSAFKVGFEAGQLGLELEENPTRGYVTVKRVTPGAQAECDGRIFAGCLVVAAAVAVEAAAGTGADAAGDATATTPTSAAGVREDDNASAIDADGTGTAVGATGNGDAAVAVAAMTGPIDNAGTPAATNDDSGSAPSGSSAPAAPTTATLAESNFTMEVIRSLGDFEYMLRRMAAAGANQLDVYFLDRYAPKAIAALGPPAATAAAEDLSGSAPVLPCGSATAAPVLQRLSRRTSRSDGKSAASSVASRGSVCAIAGRNSGSGCGSSSILTRNGAGGAGGSSILSRGSAGGNGALDKGGGGNGILSRGSFEEGGSVDVGRPVASRNAGSPAPSAVRYSADGGWWRDGRGAREDNRRRDVVRSFPGRHWGDGDGESGQPNITAEPADGTGGADAATAAIRPERQGTGSRGGGGSGDGGDCGGGMSPLAEAFAAARKLSMEETRSAFGGWGAVADGLGPHSATRRSSYEDPSEAGWHFETGGGIAGEALAEYGNGGGGDGGSGNDGNDDDDSDGSEARTTASGGESGSSEQDAEGKYFGGEDEEEEDAALAGRRPAQQVQLESVANEDALLRPASLPLGLGASAGTGAAVFVWICNGHTALALQVAWIDRGGELALRQTLQPGESYFERTFVGHPWAFRTGLAATLAGDGFCNDGDHVEGGGGGSGSGAGECMVVRIGAAAFAAGATNCIMWNPGRGSVSIAQQARVSTDWDGGRGLDGGGGSGRGTRVGRSPAAVRARVHWAKAEALRELAAWRRFPPEADPDPGARHRLSRGVPHLRLVLLGN